MTTCPQARPALFKRWSLALVLVFIIGILTTNAAHAQMVTDTFHFTGAAQTWTVPPNVTTILVEAIGGDGGGSDTGYLGSAGTPSSPGGYVKADVAVSGGQVLNIYVGGGGTKYTPGWNGGGIAGTVVYDPIGIFGAGGGGASDIRIGGTTLYDRILVAGAGGGAAYGSAPVVGGSGGGLVGGNGRSLSRFYTPGKGGTQSAGGAAGSGLAVVAPGSFGVGGGSGTYHTAGGGGGWYGGGSGSGIASAGGGSSYTDSTLCSNVVHRQGDANSIADGAIYITYCNASIYQQPLDTITCDGGTAYFAVTTSGSGLAFQWQMNTGSGWSDVAGGGSRSLSFNATSAMNGAKFRMRMLSPCNADTIYSNVATLTVNSAPSVTVQPASSTICENTNTSFSVRATGTGLIYQWQVNTGSGWTNLSNIGIYSGASTDSLVLTGATSSYNGYQYRCVVSGTCTPVVTSNAASLTIHTAPVITGQPVDKTICNGNNTYYKVGVTGTGLTYQWQVNTGSGWTNLPNTGIYSGSTTDSLVLTAATTAQNGYQYRVVVSGTCSPSVTSSAASLTIDTAPALTSQPINRTTCSGGNTIFGVTATGTSLTYQWQVNSGSGWNNISNGGIYSGATTATLSLTGASTSYNGYRYRVVVSGTCSPSATSVAATLTVNSLPSISVNPIDKTICDGGNTSYTVTATGTSISYQWQVNTGSGWSNISDGGVYSGATTSLLTLTGATTTYNGYQYRVVVSGICNPSVTSVAATLTVNSLPSISVNPIDKTICDGGNTSYTVTATGTGISYQWQVNTGSGWNNISNGGIYSGAITATLSLTGASTSYNGYQYRVVVSGTCNPSITSVAATLTVNSLPSISVNPINKTICDGGNTTYTVMASGTVISYQWQVNTGSGWNNISNGGVYSGATTATLSLTGASTSYNGYQYRCVVSGTCTPLATSSVASLTVHPIVTPTVGITSSATTICATTSVTFTVSSSSNGGNNPSYQWKVNGNNVGSNSTSFTTTGLSNGDVVTCVMTTTAPCPTSTTATSNGITMTVNPLLIPTISISSATSDSVCDTRLATFTANITNGGSAPIYQWKINGSNVGTNSAIYTTNSLSNGDVVSCELSSNALCATPNVVNSNKIKMRVIPLSYASATIAATPETEICKGDQVVVHCYYTNGGASPKFEWYLNGNLQSNTAGSYTTTNFNDNDAIYCVYTNGNVCPVPVTTNTELMTVYQTVSPSVTVVASSGSVIAPGWTVTFTAQPTNGGATPSYAWRKNGQFVQGATSVTYTDNDLHFGDKIDVVMKADWLCKDREYVSSNALLVNVPTGTDNVQTTSQAISLYPNPNNRVFTVKGNIGKSEGQAKVYIINSMGQKVYTGVMEVRSGAVEQQFSLPQSISAGMYLLSIEVDGVSLLKRFSILE